MSFTYVRCRGPLAEWTPILEQWVGLVSRFPGRGKDEELVRAPYWYTERANVGLLAGAALVSGWVALEEIQHDKGKGPDETFRAGSTCGYAMVVSRGRSRRSSAGLG